MANLSPSNQVKLNNYKERLQAYYKAEERILEGQSYTIGSRSLTRADLAEVRNAISDLEAKVNALETRGTTKRKAARIIPRDF